MLTPNYSIHYEPGLGSDEEELCVVIHPITNFTAVKCNEKHYRYCLLNSLEKNEEDMDRDGCEDLSDFNYWRFWSPRPTCLKYMTHFEGKIVGVTWLEAQKICVEKKGNLLSTGWIYATSSVFHIYPAVEMLIPLGVMQNVDNKTLEIVNDDITVSNLYVKILSCNLRLNFILLSRNRDYVNGVCNEMQPG